MEQLLVNGVCRGASYAVLAAGFSTVFLTTRVFHLAFASTCVVAAYVVHTIVVTLGGNIILGCLAGLAAAALLGTLIEVGLYYPLQRRGSGGTSLLLASIAATVLAENALNLVFGGRPRLLFQPHLPPLHIGDLVLASSQYSPLVAAAVLAPTVYAILRFTGFGLFSRAVAYAPEAAAIQGVNVRLVRAASVALGSAIGALGFVLHVSDAAVTPHAASQVTIVAALSAGVARGHPTGAMLTAFVLGFAQSLLLLWAPTRWEPVTTALLLLAAVLWRPDGFMPSKRDDE